MTFASREKSAEDGQPYTLYLIEWGGESGAVYAYTDLDRAVDHGGNTYVPIPIGREDIEQTGSLDKTLSDINIDPRAEIVQRFHLAPPSHPVGLRIFAAHTGESQVRAIWSGRITGVSGEARLARLHIEPLETSMRRTGLRRHYQYLCPHILFGPECGVDPNAGRRTATTTAVGANFIEIPLNWHGAVAATDFLGGFIRWQEVDTGVSATRSIYQVQNGATRLILQGRLSGLEVGQSVEIFMGCPRTRAGCNDLHSNIVNFGGFSTIPRENPIGRKNQFY